MKNVLNLEMILSQHTKFHREKSVNICLTLFAVLFRIEFILNTNETGNGVSEKANETKTLRARWEKRVQHTEN